MNPKQRRSLSACWGEMCRGIHNKEDLLTVNALCVALFTQTKKQRLLQRTESRG